ncbi:hypothetical protein HIM_04798 [Hirsutella minnesotensis 3608]|uniref:Uncharacterized protein n=1 Tax=Hirsutella minnesotensis 3608 TaxID=1043627 RepID=A0A0F8A5V2_9HYPO|nr:hypothetical protein HIM_04798 [Hirsutella minnesotensis 3608]
MERSPSPVNNASSAASASSASSKQPTYTTAGTIYDPSTAQPLQPPARRGRSAKWTLGNPHNEVSLFPKNLLAGITSKSLASGSGRVASSFKQYTPLQQNYDRAVSPVSELEHSAMNVSITVPRCAPGNGSPSASYLSPDKQADPGVETDLDAIPKTDDDCPSNGDDESNLVTKLENIVDADIRSMSPLFKMPVNSLKNLASYKNPYQTRALKVLDPNFGGSTAARATNSPVFSRPDLSSAEDPDKDLAGPSMGLLRPDSADAQSTYEYACASARLLPTTRPLSPVSSVDLNASSPSASFAVAAGPPQPLTAGPPGHRQYVPSTFEATFRALQSQPPELSTEEAHASATAQKSIEEIGIEDIEGLSMDPLDLLNCLERIPISMLVEDSEPDYTYYNAPRPHILTFGPWNPTEPWESALDKTNIHWQDPACRDRYMPGSARLTDEALKRRNEAIQALWTSGTFESGGSSSPAQEEFKVCCEPYKYGAIGDGRPRRVPTGRGSGNKVEANGSSSSKETQRFNTGKHGWTQEATRKFMTGFCEHSQTSDKGKGKQVWTPEDDNDGCFLGFDSSSGMPSRRVETA